MSCNRLTIFGCAALSLSFLAAGPVRAQEEAAEPAADGAAEESERVDPKLTAEIDYVTALINAGLPAFANEVMAAAKVTWPESEAMFFGLTIRGILTSGEKDAFERAKAEIDKLGERTSEKYWAARLELANYYFLRGDPTEKGECFAIYDEFFKANAKPGKGLITLARTARFQYTQILLESGERLKAAESYDKLLAMLNPNGDDDDEVNLWCTYACETAELYMSLAAADKDHAKARLASAKKYISKLLWRQDKPVYFGRAIAMMAYYELLKGSVARAQAVIDDYWDELSAIHQSLVKFDPTGSLGALRLSPMPQCRYLMAEKYWKEVQEEFKKPGRDDEKIKTLLYGSKKKDGKGRDGKGAYNEAINVYLRFPQSVWAPAAGRLQKEIAQFTKENYGVEPKFNATPEQERHVMEEQFKVVDELFAARDWMGVITNATVSLETYPETDLSVTAIHHVADSYLNLLAEGKAGAEEKAKWRITLDAIEGYLAERFGGHDDQTVVLKAADATYLLAQREDGADHERGKRLYRMYLESFRSIPDVANVAVSEAGRAFELARTKELELKNSDAPDEEIEALKASRDAAYLEALEYYELLIRDFKNSTHYIDAYSFKGTCLDRLGRRAEAIVAASNHVALLDKKANPLKYMKADMRLASLYQSEGADLIARYEADPDGPEAEMLSREGSRQFIYGLKRFNSFSEEAKAGLNDQRVNEADKAEYKILREGALYLSGESWNRFRPPKGNKITPQECWKRAAASFETYVEEFPEGKYAKTSYLRLSRLYAKLEDVEKGRDALLRLKRHFPNEPEAKKALPQLAASLIAYARTVDDLEKRKAILKSACEIYREMIETGGKDYSALDFVRAGEALVDAQDWDLATEAFSKGVKAEGASKTVIARASIGRARSYLAQNEIEDARQALDEFLADEEMTRQAVSTNACVMMITVALKQAQSERDTSLRRKHFGEAIRSTKRIAGFWRGKDKKGHARATPDQLDWLDLRGVDISICQMETEAAMGDKEASAKAMSKAALKLHTYITSHKPTAERPITAFRPEERRHLEQAYADFVKVLERMGEKHLDELVAVGRAFQRHFPTATDEHKTLVQNAIDAALEKGAKEPDPEAEVETSVEETVPASEAEEGAESETEDAAESGTETAEAEPEAEPEAEAEAEESSDGQAQE